MHHMLQRKELKVQAVGLFVLIPRRVDMDFKRWKTVEASNIRMLPNVKQVYFLSFTRQNGPRVLPQLRHHIVSITHRAAEKS